MILGASFDTPEKNKAFRDKFDFPFDLLCDVDRRIGLAYGAADSARRWMPRRISYLIDPQSRVAKVYANVTPASHPDEVLNDIG